MKKLASILAAAALVATATTAFAGTLAATGVNGSSHDMTIRAGVTETYGRVCVFCHTPHNTTATGSTDAAPLWNHAASGIAAASWKSYAWATPSSPSLAIVDPLTGPTRLCMSCHDGVVAVDQHGSAGPMSGSGSNILSGDKAIGASGDLTNDHPVGFSYGDAVIARGAGADGTGELAAKTDTFATAIVLTIESVLYNGDVMTCASCHEVHNKNNATQVAGVGGVIPNYFLYAQETKSLICLSCHVK